MREDLLLYDPARHEALRPLAWDEDRVRRAIAHIVADTEARFSEERYWPLHPRDAGGEDPERPLTPLYHGACGVIWALRYLQGAGAATLTRSYDAALARLPGRNRDWMGASAEVERASYLMGETPIRLLAYGANPDPDTADRLSLLIAGNLAHPARELMWGSPGTLLAALFLHGRTGDERWAGLFRSAARKLWSELQWSSRHECAYWTQDLYGTRSAYLGAVHGFAGTAAPLIRGRHLLEPGEWNAWQRCIAATVRQTAIRSGPHANWLEGLDDWARKMLLQVCHGAPGFVLALADFPGTELDDLLCAAGELTWSAGPLAKGSNLCHGTGGNGYALLALYGRTGDPVWLERARGFAMHGIVQTQAAASHYGHMHHSLWTGDPGFAIYLWDCLRGEAQFPTLDVFWP
jgi:hypothetical protein